MVGPLALVGGEELKPGNEPQDEVLVRASGNGQAFVLATAAARQRPELAVRNAQKWFASLGLEVEELPVLRRSEAMSAGVAARAAEGRFFYVVGGDPGRVVDVLRDSPVWAAIVEAWRKGAALAGSSAGAMAFGQWTLIHGGRPGSANRRFKDGLGLVPRTAVAPHFETVGHRWVDSARSTARDVVLVGIDGASAALWENGTWRALGHGGVTLIAADEHRRFEAGEPIEGLPDPAA